ncbi:ribosome recycling factor [Haloplasma contractile]|uniref:Ribosome-recycling factor n=1 Tax=Haloplasma contractile SSD-17B TaxID=1033810 RepID=U2FL24_9MOLU|nr:ribosome recycling factor [Haloplasma contractile]ERJ13470.1 Ribosome-recycling factor protein [Haloplasma contractile SSD-17B]
MPETILLNTEEKMDKSIESLRHELATVRTGRANPSLLDRVSVVYYGAPSPLNQVASITVPEARQLLIKPYDKSILGDIERAINEANLGLNPNNDGNIIRISIPSLTEERRKELAKVVHKYGEEGKVAIRNVRRDSNDALKKMNKNGDLTDDDLKGYQDDVQELTDQYISKIENMVSEKEQDLMTV